MQDPHLTQWVHRTLMRVLDVDLLPVYLDILQVLKAKVLCYFMYMYVEENGTPVGLMHLLELGYSNCENLINLQNVLLLIYFSVSVYNLINVML